MSLVGAPAKLSFGEEPFPLSRDEALTPCSLGLRGSVAKEEEEGKVSRGKKSALRQSHTFEPARKTSGETFGLKANNDVSHEMITAPATDGQTRFGRVLAGGIHARRRSVLSNEPSRHVR